MENDVEAVKRANESFYRAFEGLDIQTMEAVWSKEDYVKCIHPGWEVQMGWPSVRDSWVLIFNNTHAMRFSVCLVDARIYGDCAVIVCLESISTRADEEKWLEGQVLATNIFECRDGRWLMVHHHGSPLVPQG